MKTKHKAIFITGTDTGVGKTFITYALGLSLKKKGFDVGIMKPVETGVIKKGKEFIGSDDYFLRKNLNIKDSSAITCPYKFSYPLAPLVASEIEKKDIDINKIIVNFKLLLKRHQILLIEGAGGLMAPITEKLLVADLIKIMNIPMMIVCRPGLGTINHTLLSIKCAARFYGLEIKGFIINNFPKNPGICEKTNPRIIEKFSGISLLGIMPKIGKKDFVVDIVKKNINLSALI
jgi:dethiobiotin synthetase